MEQRIEMRRQGFKQGFGDPRRRRDAQQSQVRRENRDQRLTKKRADAVQEITYAYREKLPGMVEALVGMDPELQLKAAKKFRKLLSVDHLPPIQDVIDSGVVPTLIRFLNDDSRPVLQFEAAWALTNIASGSVEQTDVVVNCGAVPVFIRLLSTSEKQVREQAVWGLGNISGDCAECRDTVLKQGGLKPLLAQVEAALSSRNMTMLRNATWALCNLCRGKPGPPFQLIEEALPTLAELLRLDDKEVLTDTCWAFSHISDGPDAIRSEIFEKIIHLSILSRLVTILDRCDSSLHTPALRTLGNIVTGNDLQTEAVIAAGALDVMSKLLYSQSRGTRKEACWTLSNITAGTTDQVEVVLQANVMPRVIELLCIEDFQVQREAAWVVCNAISGGTDEQVGRIVELDCLEPLCNLLSANSEPNVIGMILEALERVLKVGAALNPHDNPYLEKIELAGGYPKLEELQHHTSSQVYMMAYNMMTKYFPFEVQPDEDGASFPAEGTFDFGGAS